MVGQDVGIYTAVQTFIRNIHRFDGLLQVLLFLFVNTMFKDIKGVIRNCGQPHSIGEKKWT